MQCQCGCGHVNFEIQGSAKLRMLCHCSICQKFNQSTHADVLVFKSNQIVTPDNKFVAFKTFKAPPNVQRGTCIKCDQPAIEVFSFPLMPKLTMVPADMFVDDSKLPNPRAHMFYENRVNDFEDSLPKHNGFLKSQYCFFKYLWF
jgi:hypothetical protein